MAAAAPVPRHVPLVWLIYSIFTGCAFPPPALAKPNSAGQDSGAAGNRRGAAAAHVCVHDPLHPPSSSPLPWGPGGPRGAPGAWENGNAVLGGGMSSTFLGLGNSVLLTPHPNNSLLS